MKDVSFDVTRGEIFGLLGANGAGKTTMFRMLCGLLPASGGALQVAGVDVRTTAAAARARIGYMSQKFSLYGTLSVLDNLRFFSSAYGLTGSRRRERIDWAIDEFELASVADDNSGSLPLGYKQRLALACALMHEPEIIFLDEPTSGVDPLARREFWHRINTLAAQERHGAGDDALHGRSRILRPHGDHDGWRNPRLGNSRRNQTACSFAGESGTDDGRGLYPLDRDPFF